MELKDFNEFSDNAGASEPKTEQPAPQTEQTAAQPTPQPTAQPQQTDEFFFSAPTNVYDGTTTKTYGATSYAEDNSRYDNNFFPLPKEDYKENGQLKPVRKRMLKKLLKYEFKELFPSLAIGVGLVLGFALLLFVSGWFIPTTTSGPTQTSMSDYPFYWGLAFFLFAGSSTFLSFVPLISSWKRYSKSFFQSEGYLTFSVPASVHEHLLAKHISAFVAYMVASFSVAIGIIMAITPVAGEQLFTGIFGSLGDAFRENAGLFISDLLYTIVRGIISPILLFTFCGAFQCWNHRGVQKRTIVLAIIGVYFGFYIFIAFLSIWANAEIYKFIGSPVFRWLSLIGQLLLICLFYYIEKRTLTKKLNLK
jgi:hypothetical protein